MGGREQVEAEVAVDAVRAEPEVGAPAEDEPASEAELAVEPEVEPEVAVVVEPARQPARAPERMLAGRYELGDRLGRGGMGTVWRAKDRMLDREVAVKELTVNHLPEEDLAILQSRMKQEARAAARIKHPGVITIHDVLEQDGRPWIVMELIDGRSLADVIAQDGTLAPRDAAEVGAQVLAALHRGHQLGVLHRDVKPANVLLEHGTGRAVLLDFGIASLEGSSELTRPGDLVGSPDYLAPERAQGERPGAPSDLWGLGATLYAAVEGQSPFRRDSPLSTLAAVVSEPLPEPTKAGALGPVLAALMEKDAADRPSADEALRMLHEVAAGHTVGIKAAPPLDQRKQIQRTPTQVVPVVDRRPAEQPPEQLPTAERGPTALTRVGPPTAVPTMLGPLAAPTPVRRPSERRAGLRLALAGLAAAVLAGTAAFLVTTNLHGGTVLAGTDQSPSSAVTATGPEDVTASPALSGPAPTGYQWQTDEEGFRFPLPTDGGTWTRKGSNNNIYYSADGQRHLIQFAKTVGQLDAPLDHLRSMEVANHGLKDYHQVSMGRTQVRGREAAAWVWTFTCTDTCPNPGPRKVFEEAYRDAGGTEYAILVSGPLADATLTERRFTTILNNFTSNP